MPAINPLSLAKGITGVYNTVRNAVSSPSQPGPGAGISGWGQGDYINPNGTYTDVSASRTLNQANTYQPLSELRTTTESDPYSQWGGKANYDSYMNHFNTGKQNVQSGVNDAIGTSRTGLQRGILDFVDTLRDSQRQIDTSATNNELAKMQGVQGVQGMVGRGIKSGGVMLANKNAGDSSAASALARAYGDLGQRELGKVGNQYEMANRGIQDAQTSLEEQKNTYVNRKFGEGKEDSINNIVNAAAEQLAQLDAYAADKSLPERIAIDQEKARIRAQATADLQGLDQYLREQTGSVQASSQDVRRQQAAELQRAGTNLGAGAFEYATEAPSQFQNTGPFSSELPLFTLGKRRIA